MWLLVYVTAKVFCVTFSELIGGYQSAAMQLLRGFWLVVRALLCYY